MNWKECGKKWSRINLKYYHGICLEGMRRTKTPVRTAGLQAEI
jgi:hypothetical protein